MTEPSAFPETGPLTELPALTHGVRRFAGSAGLAIVWQLEAKTKPPSLHCALFALAPDSDHAGGTPAGVIRLSLEAHTQSFQIERRIGPGAGEPDGSDVDPRQASGVIYLGRKNDRPGQLRIDGAIAPDEPIYLHVHCRLGASSGFLGKIACGSFGQLQPQAAAEPAPATPDNTPAPVAQAPAPSKSAAAASKSAPAKSKPRGGKSSS